MWAHDPWSAPIGSTSSEKCTPAHNEDGLTNWPRKAMVRLNLVLTTKTCLNLNFLVSFLLGSSLVTKSIRHQPHPDSWRKWRKVGIECSPRSPPHPPHPALFPPSYLPDQPAPMRCSFFLTIININLEPAALPSSPLPHLRHCQI